MLQFDELREFFEKRDERAQMDVQEGGDIVDIFRREELVVELRDQLGQSVGGAGQPLPPSRRFSFCA